MNTAEDLRAELELAQENERLTDERIAALRADIEGMREDAERYRAKREIDMYNLIDSTSYAHANNRGKEMMRTAWLASYDAAIDAARKESSK